MGARGWFSDEEPVHEVGVSEGFWMLEAPVTQAQYVALTGLPNPSYFSDAADAADRPVERINWFDAQAACQALTADTRRWTAALPSEAQWEYACRAGSTSEYANGDGVAALRQMGWFAGHNENWTHAVKRLAPNAWNLYDMHGNVWEWCYDRWDARAYSKRQEGIWDAGTRIEYDISDPQSWRVLRGGAYGVPAAFCRSAVRGRWRAGDAGWNRGFRPCLLPGPVKPSKKEKAAEPPARLGPGERSEPGTRQGGRVAPADDTGLRTKQP